MCVCLFVCVCLCVCVFVCVCVCVHDVPVYGHTFSVITVILAKCDEIVHGKLGDFNLSIVHQNFIVLGCLFYIFLYFWQVMVENGRDPYSLRVKISIKS